MNYLNENELLSAGGRPNRFPFEVTVGQDLRLCPEVFLFRMDEATHSNKCSVHHNIIVQSHFLTFVNDPLKTIASKLSYSNLRVE